MLSLDVLANALILVGIFTVSAAESEPAIRLFESHIVLDANGAADITEKIRFGDGVAIEREVPTRRLLWSGLREVSRIKLVNAILDGEPTALTSRSTPRGVLWSPASHPGPGEHVMILRYRADERVFAGHDADLFIWDATGYRWKIPIDKVRLSFQNPSPAAKLNYSVLNGKPGALVDSDRRSMKDAAEIHWTREETLPPGEGVRLILRIPPGSVRSTTSKTANRMLRDNLHVALGFFGAFALALFLFLERHALNRDPDPGAKPDGPGADLSYAAARFLTDGRYTGKTLQAGVAGLVAKRWLRGVQENNEEWTFDRGETDAEVLTLDERALGEALLGTQRESTLIGTAAFETALGEHVRALEGLWTPHLRAHAWIPLACAIAWSAGIVSAMRAAAALFDPVPIPIASTLGMGAICIIGGLGLTVVWTITYKAWRAASLPNVDGKTRMIPLLTAIALGFLSFGLVTAAAGAFQTAIGDLAPAALLAGFTLLAANWVGFYALRGPTPEGFDALRRARMLTERSEEKTFQAALKATDSLALAVDNYL